MMMGLLAMTLQMTAQNRRTVVKATDFAYKTATGVQGHLYGIRARYVLLFFNRPDCDDCGRTKTAMGQSKVLRRLTATRRGGVSELVVLAVAPNEDLELWRKAHYPRFVVNAYDVKSMFLHRSAYDLTSIPCLYLLDAAKRMVLRKTSIEKVERYLAPLA
jgi:hypothetical protein